MNFMHEADDRAVAISAGAPRSRLRDAAWWTFVGISTALLPLMIRASFDFGVTWDEKARHHNGELIWEFLRGLRGRYDFIDDGGQYYGGLFDTLCVALERYVALDRYVFRHIVNATFGWIGIVYCGRLAARLFGRWAGVLSLVLLATSPRYFAESMNNPKDLPFAAMTIVALYYFSTISPNWPYVSASTAIKIAIAIGLALNIRAGALLYLGYLGLLLATYVIAERNWNWRRLTDTAVRVAAIVVGVLLIGTLVWPWAQARPLTRPFQALFAFSNFDYIADMLFAGRVVASNNLPWYYAPWWIIISTPPVVLIGIVLSLIHSRAMARSRAALWFASVFPIAIVIIQNSTLYDGVRHLLFVYPVLVVLAASGWALWLDPANAPVVRRVAGAMLIAGLVNVGLFHIRSYPNQTVYFNELVGGPRGAFGRYEMDYWGNCVLEAVTWSAELARRSGIALAISGEPFQVVHLDVERYPQLFYTLPYRNQHHLDVQLARGSEEVIKGLAGSADALYRVRTADGAVLCIIRPGPRFAEVESKLVVSPAE